MIDYSYGLWAESHQANRIYVFELLSFLDAAMAEVVYCSTWPTLTFLKKSLILLDTDQYSCVDQGNIAFNVPRIHSFRQFNALVPESYGYNFIITINVFFKLTLWIEVIRASCEIGPQWAPQNRNKTISISHVLFNQYTLT